VRRGFLAWISPRGIIIATIVFAIADTGDQLVGPSFLGMGLFDETAHVLTTLLVLWAIGGVLFDRLLIPALVASVAIDLDHIPGELGYHFLTEGTPRPYTHSLLSIAVVLVAAYLWTRRSEVLLGIAVGLGIHFWRDMAEPGSGVALFWPFSDASCSYSHVLYLIAMGLVIVLGMRRSLRCRVRRPASRATEA
jgi:membrane-bound metal-dependent hydrolase YbcI (DUF457 family)